jgi:hypothetical protein
LGKCGPHPKTERPASALSGIRPGHDFNEIFTIPADGSCLMHLRKVLRYYAQVPKGLNKGEHYALV